jgi:hypothetical protein
LVIPSEKAKLKSNQYCLSIYKLEEKLETEGSRKLTVIEPTGEEIVRSGQDDVGELVLLDGR